jgi:EpsI family protein
MLILVLTGFFISFASPLERNIDRKTFNEFPEKLGNWRGIQNQQFDEGSLRILQVDDYMMRYYRNEEGESIGVYIGYFKFQKAGKGIHSPRQCLPGAGWIPTETGIHDISIPGNSSGKISVNQYIVENAGEKYLYLFWYVGRNRIYASEWLNKYYLIIDAISKKRTDGALIRVHSPIKKGVKATLEKQDEIIRSMFPFLNQFVPN